MARSTVRVGTLAGLLIAGVAWAGGAYDFEEGTARVASVPPKGPDSEPDPEIVHLLNLEFERVAAPLALALPDRALDALVHVKAGDLDALIDGTSRYDHAAAEWRTYTRTWLTEVQGKLADVTLPAHVLLHSSSAPFSWDVETKSGTPAEQVSLALLSPEPEAGMPGKAEVEFGPVVDKPAGSKNDGPDRWTVEFYWLGQVMPAANGPKYAHPSADRKGPGAWQLADIVEPWSRRTMMRL